MHSAFILFRTKTPTVNLVYLELLAHITVIDGLSDRQRQREGEEGWVYSLSSGMFHVACRGAAQKIHTYLCLCV